MQSQTNSVHEPTNVRRTQFLENVATQARHFCDQMLGNVDDTAISQEDKDNSRYALAQAANLCSALHQLHTLEPSMTATTTTDERMQSLQNVATQARYYCDEMLDDSLRGDSVGLSWEEMQKSRYAFTQAKALREAVHELWKFDN